MKVFPFICTHPQPELASQVAAVPWDILSVDDVRAELAARPLSFLGIDVPQALFGPQEEPDVAQAAQAAADLLHERLRDGTLQRDPQTCFYLYRITQDGHSQTAVVGACSVNEYAQGVIKQHEQVREPKVADRVEHMRACHAQASPVFAFYRDNPAVDALVFAATLGQPLIDFDDAAGMRHQVWRVARKDAVDAFVAAFDTVQDAYIADGHHRAAAAARVAEQLRAENPGFAGNEPWNGFLCALFPASQVRVLPYRLADASHADAPAPSVEQVMEVCDAGELMPPKSTYFDPKPASGLFVYEY